MRADRDDAPLYLQVQHQSGGFIKWLIAGAIGCGITAGMLLWVGVDITNLQSKAPIALPAPAPAVSEAPPAPPPLRFTNTQEVDRTAEDRFWADHSKREKQAKQTDFNDSNYIPKAPANVVSTEGIRQSAAYRDQTPQRVTRTRQIEHDGHWVDKWSGGARYYAKWMVVNNNIDSSSVCTNHKRGSVDYRECRKGAKQFFKEQCKAWRSSYDADQAWNERMKIRYCSAANSFSPMG